MWAAVLVGERVGDNAVEDVALGDAVTAPLAVATAFGDLLAATGAAWDRTGEGLPEDADVAMTPVCFLLTGFVVTAFLVATTLGGADDDDWDDALDELELDEADDDDEEDDESSLLLLLALVLLELELEEELSKSSSSSLDLLDFARTTISNCWLK